MCFADSSMIMHVVERRSFFMRIYRALRTMSGARVTDVPYTIIYTYRLRTFNSSIYVERAQARPNERRGFRTLVLI